MEIQRIYSDLEGDEVLFSVLMDENELEMLYSATGAAVIAERAARKASKNAWVKSQGGRRAVRQVEDRILSRAKFLGDGASVSRIPSGGKLNTYYNKRGAGKSFLKNKEHITGYRYDHPMNDYEWNKDMVKTLMKR